ncbi:MAG: threo-3-hydroxy-L-aspartate ammonia-lyase [Flavobacteriaceae bacterium]
MTETPTFEDVRAAAKRLDGVAHRTPVLTSRTLDERLGASLFFKAENFQRGGAFKFRGAYNAISLLDPAVRRHGIVAFSSGNHAQGIAYAAKLHGVPAVIVMPDDVPAAKREATQGYGAEIVSYDRYGAADRLTIAREIAERRSMTLIPPFDHPGIIAGQGTVALELIEETGPLDALLVCTGGGGLLAGCAIAAHAVTPDCAVVGVEPEAGDDARQSMAKGEIVAIATPRTLADGAQTTAVGTLNFVIMRQLVSEIVTVPDTALVEAMRFFAERMKIVVEPTGCLAAAAAMSGAYPVEGKRVGVVISGGNADLKAYAALLAG